MPAMLTVKQAAKQVGMCESVVYCWCATGQFPHYRLGKKGRGKIMIAEVDLVALISSNRVEKKQPEPAKAPARTSAAFTHLKIS